ncbi:hypothetical protein [Geodermatophilus sp. SYSU D00815]
MTARQTATAKRARKPRSPLEYSDHEAMDAVLTAPHVVAMFSRLPGPADTGRSRDYPEPVYLGFELVKGIYGSARRTEHNLGDPEIWDRFLRALIRAVPGDQRLKALRDTDCDQGPIRAYHYRYAARTWLNDVRPDLEKAAFEAAAELAQQLEQCTEDGPSTPNRPQRSGTTKWDGHVMKSLHTRRELVDKKTGEITEVKGDADADDFKTGKGWVHGLEFVYGLTLGNGRPWTQVVLHCGWVPKHGLEVDTAEKGIEAVKGRLPGMDAILYDGAMPGAVIGRLAGDHGLAVVSPVSAAEAATDSKPRVEKSKFIRTHTHQRNGRDCQHSLYYYGGRIIETGRRAGDGSLPVRELRYLGARRKANQAEIDRREAEKNGTASTRRARRGGRDVPSFQWYVEYELQCGNHIEVVRERTLTDPSKDKINRSENVRQVPPGTSAYQELYPHRSSIEGFNSWVDGRFWLRRARCKGAARQQLEQLGMVCLYNALVWRANEHLLATRNALPDAA